jgi:hypothetical protein
MVDLSYGSGNVIVFTIPGDGDWTMWPSSPTFPPVMIDLVDYLVGSGAEEGVVELGGEVSYPVDMSAYDSRVSLRDPQNEKVESIAKPNGESNGGEPDSNGASVLYRVNFDGVQRRGFYELGLSRHTGEEEMVLFAANVDPRESQLKRIPASALEGDFLGEKVTMVAAGGLVGQQVSGGETEIWLQILLFLFAVLVLEQVLGWFWGKKR